MKINKKDYSLDELKIKVTYKCPLSCIHCSSDSLPSNNKAIEKEKCFSILDDALKLNVKEVAFSGGEPLIYPYLLDLIQHINNKKIKLVVYTSGIVDDIGQKIKFLKANGISKVIFSLFGSEENSHQQITRIIGSFQKTIEAIKLSLSNGVSTEIHFVALKANYRELENLAINLKQFGVERISVLRFVPQGRGFLLNNQILDKLENIELKSIIEKLRKRGFNIRTGSPYNFLFLNDNPKCNSAINRLIITPDLNIYPCDAFKQIESKDIVGSSKYSNLFEHSLIDCWNSSPYLNKIREYLETDFLSPCKECKSLNNCNSGCLAQKILKQKNLIKVPDPSCLYY